MQRETLDHLYEAIAVFGSDGRLKLWNPAYAEIWHLAPDDLAGEPHVSEIIEKTRGFYNDGGDWPALKRDIIARITGHGAGQTQLERQDGTVLQAVTVPLPDGNILLSDLDVTDSTRVENALRERNEALETAGRLKSEFVANVSYELRTPLNVIIGFSEILTNQYFGELNPRQLDYSRGILESSNRLLSLINDILDLATIEAGYMTLETQQIDIHAMMSGVLALSRERARNQGLTVRFDVSATIGTVVADERRLKQALFNLVSNALKFTLPGGTITLSAHREGGRVALAVADTGVGVPEQDQTRIFERVRARQSTRAIGAGPRPVAGEELHRAAWRQGRAPVAPGPGHHRHVLAQRPRRHPRLAARRPAPPRRRFSSGPAHALGGRIFEMQRLARMEQRVDRVRSERRLGKARQDELQFTGIGGDVADREYPRDRGHCRRRRDRDLMALQREPPLRDRTQILRQAEKRQQHVRRQAARAAFEIGDHDRREPRSVALERVELIGDH